MLEGQTIMEVKFVGGMLEIDTEDMMIVFSDGVTPRYYEETKDFPKKHQFAFYFDDDTALICTIRMYGFINVCPKGACTEEYISSSTKPNPLYASTVKMLRKMCEEGGRDTESDIFGNPGGYITQLSKKSLEEPCMKCGSPIHKANYMGGTVYFCEKCQKR